MTRDLLLAACASAFVVAALLMIFGSAAIQYIAAAFGIAGATLLATMIHPAWGFGAFLLSNLGWMAFSWARRQWGQFGQQIAFVITSLVGLWNWWLGPLVLG